ncbi:MAG: hypothetical protein EA342_14765 [Leptolyngbya sp. LCM1.Bin17]|nr:MAG: hypothetical protein EA342_14765 [Leptolyngbya sp. LCM1.Bin17]
MGPISLQRVKTSLLTPEDLLVGSLLVLPYLVYPALLGLLGFLGLSLQRWGQAVWQLLYGQGWSWLGLGLILSTLGSQAPGESVLQLTNFLPFFGLYGAIAIALVNLQQPLTTLRTWAMVALLATIPINLRAVLEYYLNAPENYSRWLNLPWLHWLYGGIYYGHRASSVFGHPNVLASYMVMVFGLGLGLCAYCLQTCQRRRLALWIYAATLLSLVGIFCSGSRNGLLVAGFQVLLFVALLRPSRQVLLAGLGSLGAVAVGTLIWGVGGRSLAESFATITLRLDVWQAAWEMIPNHPWLGSGLGTFKLLYEPYAVPPYDSLGHAHNLWLMLALEAGIPVAIGFTIIVGWIMTQGSRTLLDSTIAKAPKAILAGYLIGFSGNVLFAIFDLAFYDARANVLGWLMLGIIQAIPTLTPALKQLD